MIRDLLIRGLIAGVVAGLLSFGFAKTFGEPPVELAIAFEEQQAHAGHSHHDDHAHGTTTAEAAEAEPELVSRGVQAGLGLGTGVVVYSAALGGIFALVFAFAYGRLGALRARATAATLALFGFVTITLVPFLKYPPNPPAVGNPETLDLRTILFFGVIALSIAAAALSLSLFRRLQARRGSWYAAQIAIATFVGLNAAALFMLPSFNDVPAAFSASLLWDFRIATFGVQAVLWATFGLLFGALAERLLEAKRPSRMTLQRG